MGQRNAKRVLVTGGSGFIGGHVVERLVQDGHQVSVLDRTGNSNSNDSGSVQFLKADLRDLQSADHAFMDMDWVIHLAALSDPIPAMSDPLEYFQVNVSGTANALELARKHGVQRFIYASSAACYGHPKSLPTREEEPLHPTHPYGLTKAMGENLVLSWNKIYGLPTTALRFFNVYGPRARGSGFSGAVVSVFLAQKLSGKPFTVIGDGSQTRDFVHVQDVARAVALAAEGDAAGEVFNVGSGKEYSIAHLIEILGSNSDTPCVYLPRRPSETTRSCADVSKIQRVLGWKPQVTFEAGLQEILKRADEWRGIPARSEKDVQAASQSWLR